MFLSDCGEGTVLQRNGYRQRVVEGIVVSLSIKVFLCCAFNITNMSSELILIPWSSGLEKLIGPQLVKKFPPLYKVQYHVHKNLPLVPILSQMNPVYTLPSCLSSYQA
jgi:hypothetical protein